MRKKWFTFGCLTSIVIVIVIFWLIGSSVNRLTKQKIVKLDPNTYLHLQLKGELKEYNELKEEYFLDRLGDTSLSVHDIVQKINFATHDPNVRGLIIEPYFFATGYSNLNEMEKSIDKFKASGKSVYSYLEMAGNKDYLLASTADKIYMNPSASAGILLTGVGSNVLFYKDMLDKIGVEMKVIHAGKYKGAGENYSRTSFSEPVKRNLDRLFKDIYDKTLFMLSENRKIDIKKAKSIYEQREEIMINQQAALDYGLVDELLFRKEMLKANGIEKDQLLSISKYSISEKKQLDNWKIAVVYAQGNIVKSSGDDRGKLTSEKMIKMLDEIENDNNIKAVVLRVNSPGGSALESEIMLHRIKKLREKKPVVVSMGNVAASGGYYISCDADYVYADDFTITGSIGVVAMLPNIADLSQKMGINTEKIGYGKYSGLVNVWEELSEEEIASIRSSIAQTYIEFKTRVSEGRKISLDEVELVAQGQVWSAEDALDKKLIDEVGMLSDAILKAGALANMPSYTIDYYPHKISLMEYFLEEKFDIKVAMAYLTDMENILHLNELKEFAQNLIHEPIQAIMPCRFDE